MKFVTKKNKRARDVAVSLISGNAGEGLLFGQRPERREVAQSWVDDVNRHL